MAKGIRLTLTIEEIGTLEALVEGMGESEEEMEDGEKLLKKLRKALKRGGIKV